MRETPLFSVIAVCCNVAPYAERMIGFDPGAGLCRIRMPGRCRGVG